MPVDFICPHCRQLLAVPRRKVGTVIDCPRCGAPARVDEPQQVAAGGVGATNTGFADPPLSRAFEDSIDLSAPAAWSMPVRPLPPQPSWSRAAAPEPPPPRTNAPSFEGMLLVSRRAVYVQLVLFVLVATIAFAAGYFLGQDHAAGEAGSAAADDRQPVSIEGVVTYGIQGAKQKDEGAVVIAIPHGTTPAKRISAKGLRPDDAPSVLTTAAGDAIRASGGDYGRVDAEGAFQLVVRKPGMYHLLIISRHAQRGPREPIEADDARAIAAWFDLAPELIGLHQYRWTRETFREQQPPIIQSFGG